MGDEAQVAIEVVSHHGGHEVLDARRVEARQRDPSGGVRAAQFGQQHGERVGYLGSGVPKRRQQQQRQFGARPGEVPKERERRLAGPVQIVDQHDDRTSRGRHVEHRVDRGEEAVPLGVRVGARRALQSRDPSLDLRQEHGHLGELLTVVHEQFVGHCPQQMVERDDERLIGHGQLGVARAVRHGRTLPAGPPGEFDGQAGLARTGFAPDQHRLGGSGTRRGPGLEQGRPLATATDERRAARNRQRRRQCDGERLGR